MQYARYPAGLWAGMSVRLCTRSRRSFTCYVSLSRCSFPSLFLARSRSACLSPSYFDVILPCYYLDHRSRLAVREVAEKRDRDEPRSRKEVPRACNEANSVSPSVSIVSLTYRLIILANNVQSFLSNAFLFTCLKKDLSLS